MTLVRARHLTAYTRAMLPRMQPAVLVQQPAPFDDPDWIFEVKFDGFRSLAYVQDGRCELVSRKGKTYQRFKDLRECIGAGLKVDSAILDGEIVCLDDEGRSRFYDLMFRRGEPYLYAFDLLYLNGVDLRERPLLERKARLKEVIPGSASRLLYLDHIEKQGVELYQMGCERDLEGIVAKPKRSPYPTARKSCWIKVKNPSYSQAEGRRELFEARLRR